MLDVFKSHEPLILSDKELVTIDSIIQLLNIQSDIIVPISNRNRTMGVLTCMSKKKDFFTKDDISSLKLFGQMATLAIKKAQLYEETQSALEARDLFLSMAAHEFRTPLTTISGCLS